MSLINEYRQTENAIKELKTRLEQLNGDSRLKKELEFEKKLRDLMAEYSKTLKDIDLILNPNPSKKPVSQRAERKVKTYINPHTSEHLETKGGNNKLLKQWKAEFGSDVVDGWLVRD